MSASSRQSIDANVGALGPPQAAGMVVVVTGDVWVVGVVDVEVVVAGICDVVVVDVAVAVVVVIVPGVGHFLHQEAPEAVNRPLLEFIAS